MKKILIIHPALVPYRIDIFNKLSEIYDIHIIFLRKNAYSFSFDQKKLLNRLNCSFEFFTKGITIKGRILYRKGLLKAIRDFSPNIVVTHEYGLQTYQILFYNWYKNNFKHMIWSADNKQMINHECVTNYVRKNIAYKFIDGISVYSDDVKKLLNKKYQLDKNKIGVFPNVQNENSLRQDFNKLDYNSKIIKRFGNERVILYVGRLTEVKNIQLLINAFKYSLNKGLDAKLVIVGDGILREYLEEISNEYSSKIIFAGSQQGIDLKYYYRIANLFVLPSLFEPFGAVVNEALIYGIPVFCTNRAGASNLIEDNKNGQIFDPYQQPEVLGNMLISFFEKNTINKVNNRHSLMPKTFNEYVNNWLPQILR